MEMDKAKPKKLCTMDYTCKKLIDLFVLNFKAMSLTQVKVRGKKDFCIFLLENS